MFQLHGSDGRARALRRRLGSSLAAGLGLFVVLGSTSVAAFAYGGGGGTGKFVATFEARAVGDPSIDSCPGFGVEGGQKTDARYQGTMTIDGDEYEFNFTTLEALVDRSTGLGSAEGQWQLKDPRTSEIVGRGELIAAVMAVDYFHPDLELQGLLIGLVSPPDPDMPALRLIGNFTGSITDGTLNFTGSVGDPTDGELLPAVLVASNAC